MLATFEDMRRVNMRCATFLQVMTAHDKTFHVGCFKCLTCGTRIHAGETFALKGKELFCKKDYDLMLANDAHSQPASRSVTPGKGPA
jgi:hypothetical protein